MKVRGNDRMVGQADSEGGGHGWCSHCCQNGYGTPHGLGLVIAESQFSVQTKCFFVWRLNDVSLLHIYVLCVCICFFSYMNPLSLSSQLFHLSSCCPLFGGLVVASLEIVILSGWTKSFEIYLFIIYYYYFLRWEHWDIREYNGPKSHVIDSSKWWHFFFFYWDLQWNSGRVYFEIN